MKTGNKQQSLPLRSSKQNWEVAPCVKYLQHQPEALSSDSQKLQKT